MKLPTAALGLGAFVLFSGPQPELSGALTRARPEAPAWLMMPQAVRVSEIDYQLADGRRMGKLQARTRNAPDVIILQLQAEFEGMGFQTDRVEILAAAGKPKFGMLHVNQRSTGREATLVAFDTPKGRELLVTFYDEAARRPAASP